MRERERREKEGEKKRESERETETLDGSGGACEEPAWSIRTNVWR